MFERLYRIRGSQPLEEIRRVVDDARRAEATCRVIFGTPPFQRDWMYRITAVRLRFDRQDHPPEPQR